MYHPTTRVLTVLELLQAHGQISGPDLAARLEVNARTVRHYITLLQDMGIPIEAERGRAGGYRLRPGYKLPPLMFSEDEALALAVGLLAARRLGLAGAAPAVEGALAKVERVMPETLRARIKAVQETLVLEGSAFYTAPDGATVLTFSTAAQRRRLRFRPHGLVHLLERDDAEEDFSGPSHEAHVTAQATRTGDLLARTLAASYPVMRGERARYLGEVAVAEQHFERVRAIAGDSETVRNTLGTIYGRHGDLARAALEFEAALRLKPASPPRRTYTLPSSGAKYAPSPSRVWQPMQLFCSQTSLPRTTDSVIAASLDRSGKVCSLW